MQTACRSHQPSQVVMEEVWGELKVIISFDNPELSKGWDICCQNKKGLCGLGECHHWDQPGQAGEELNIDA